MKQLPEPSKSFPHVLRWDRYRRKGQRCQIIGAKNGFGEVQVRFEDGYTVVISREALRRVEDPKTTP